MANPIWMYDKKTGEGVLFHDDTNIPEGYEESPALCDCTPIEADIVSNDRDMLKAEATKLGLSFPSNVKTEKLIAMIQEETEKQYAAQAG